MEKQRKIIRGFVNGEKKSLTELDLKGKSIKEVWYIYNEDKMWDSNSFNPFTGKPIIKGEDLEGLILQHEQGVLIEDAIHDWKASEHSLHYYSRYVSLGKPADILVEFE